MYNSHSQQLVTIMGDDTLEIIEQKYRKAIEDYPQYKDEFLRNLSTYYCMNQKPQEALELMQQAIDCAPADSPNFGDYYSWLVVFYDWLDNNDAALAALQKGMELDPEDIYLKVKLGNAYIERKDYKNAVAMYALAFSGFEEHFRDYWDHPLLREMVLHEDESEDYPKSRKVLQKLLKAAETDRQRACVHFAISNIYELEEDLWNALKHSKQAKELLPNDFLTIIRLAEAHSVLGQHPEALTVYQQLPAIAESSVHKRTMLHFYYHHAAVTLTSMNNFEEAAALYKEDLKIWEDSPRNTYEALEQLSAIYYHQKQYEKMKPYAQRIIELWPKHHPKAYTSMATYCLEVEEDTENTLNYLFIASKVNEMSPERIEGFDSEVAATIYGFIAYIYYKFQKDEATAISYYEKALLCKPTKEVEESVCTSLYEIYKRNGNAKRAEELKERRSGMAKMVDLFSGDFHTELPNLKKRLANPKNDPEEIKNLPYYYTKLEGEKDSVKFRHKLQLEFYDDLMNNPIYKDYFSKYEPDSVILFCQEYSKLKISLISLAKYHMDPNASSNEIVLSYYTDRIFDLILQKKLFNMQLMWRAEKINIPQVKICHDFDIWSNQLRNCPFIEKVTPKEIQVMKQFLMDDNFCSEIGFLIGWQDYDKLISVNEEDDCELMPPWYEFYDEKMGTGSLLLLPNLRGEKENEYKQLYRKWKHKQPPDPIPSKQASTPYLNTLIGSEHDYVSFMEQFENDYICKLQQARMDEKIFADKTYDPEALRVAIMDIELAEEPVHFDSKLNWHEAILKAAQQVKNSRIADYLDTVYNVYAMQYDLGMMPSYDIDKENDDKSLRQMILNQILKGREESGESKDLDF